MPTPATASSSADSALLVTLAGVAELARVQRPTASMWRARFAAGDDAFPVSVGQLRGVEAFDVTEVAEWLTRTSHGNNPEAMADAAAAAVPADFSFADADAVAELEALVALHAHTDGFEELTVDQLRRAAAEADPRNVMFQAEIEAHADRGMRVWMAKFDAMERQSRDEPIPEEISRLLGTLVADSIAPGDVPDIYDAAGLPRLTLDHLGPDFLAKAQSAPNAHLAIEALRKSLTDAGSSATRGNLVRQRAFSERIAEIMKRYTNQQLTSAEVIAELVELAKDVASEASRGSTFSPPLSSDELAFYDAVATNESAVDVQGDDVLAQIARELVAVMRRDVRTDWTVRDDVRAKLRSSIKRLLVKYKYPPDKQPAAIKLVMDQMESMAPRYAEGRRSA